MIRFSFFPHRKIFLVTLVLALVAFATVLVAQNIPPKNEAAPAETGQVGTFDVQTVSFTPWNTDKESSGLNFEYIPTELVFFGATGFQVLDDKILYLNPTVGITNGVVTVDRKTGKKLSSVEFEHPAQSFVWENGKYYVNSNDFSIDIYNSTGTLESSTSYRNPAINPFKMVRYNGASYVIFYKESKYGGTTSDVASLPVYDNGTIGKPFDGAIDQYGNIIAENYQALGQNDFSALRVLDEHASFIKTFDGKAFTKNLVEVFAGGNGQVVGISNDRVFVRKAKADFEGNYKNYLQSYAFDKRNGVGKLMAEADDPFNGFYTKLSVLPDGTIYELFNDKKGAYVFSLKEVGAGVQHGNFPVNMESPIPVK